ncbi:MAG: polyphosphate kinase, partial [Gammaproteobacteria bacterium]|nr:polyphosphate kinase [Gammaproteobacteria bacterium]
DRVYGRTSAHEFDTKLDRILSFETALAEDGAAIVKFWMHLSQKAQERRLKNLEQDPLTAAQVTENDWENWKHYDQFVETAERAISRTHTGKAPWVIVEGEDAHYRSLTVGNAVEDTLVRFQQYPNRPSKAPAGATKAEKKRQKTRDKQTATLSAKTSTVLARLDMNRTLPKVEYREQLKHLQAKLLLSQNRARKQGVGTVLVFEGWDAAGKGSVIRRIDAALEAHAYQVHGVAQPTGEELAQHYLWRFWRHLPRDGHMAIFDRSWYGRVLVERVEGFADEQEWRRAYAEINDFEDQLIDHGIILVKYWIHITKDEQLRRFKLRKRTPHKRWKLNEEDWRNRKKWEDYEIAVHDMVQYTSTNRAPWTLVEGNDKRCARIKVLETLCDRLTQKVGEVSVPTDKEPGIVRIAK